MTPEQEKRKIRKAQGSKDSRSLLARARNLLSHPASWHADEGHAEKRLLLAEQIAEHLNGMENCEAWTERKIREAQVDIVLAIVICLTWFAFCVQMLIWIFDL